MAKTESARRSKGTGTMTEVRPGVWRLRVVNAYRPDGQPIQVSKTFKGNETQAGRALARFATEVEDGKVALSGAMTFGQYTERWLAHVAHNVNTETRRSYKQRTDALTAELGRVRLDRLRGADLDACYAKMRSNGLAASTIAAYHSVASMMLRQAVRWRLVPRNVAEDATRPRVDRREATMPTIEQVRDLIAETDRSHPVLSAAIALAALTGARRGEVLGLRWSDVDRDAMTLAIERSVKRDASGRGTEVGRPKTGNGRVLAIDDAVLEIIDAHRARVERWAANAGVTVADDGYIVTPDPSCRTPWRPDSLSMTFYRAASSAGMPGVRFHDLRHAVASYLLTSGYDPATVAHRLGHSSPAVTMRVYAHLVPTVDRRAATAMGDLLRGREQGALPHAAGLTASKAAQNAV